MPPRHSASEALKSAATRERENAIIRINQSLQCILSEIFELSNPKMKIQRYVEAARTVPNTSTVTGALAKMTAAPATERTKAWISRRTFGITSSREARASSESVSYSKKLFKFARYKHSVDRYQAMPCDISRFSSRIDRIFPGELERRGNRGKYLIMFLVFRFTEFRST